MNDTVLVQGPSAALPPASIGFIGYHPGWNNVWNDFTRAACEERPLLISLPDPDQHLPVVPDILFYSVFEERHREPRYDKCIKIFNSQENFQPPWPECDYALTGNYSTDSRHLRYPIYVSRILLAQNSLPLRHPCLTLVKDPATDWPAVLADKSGFCNFIYSNSAWRDPRTAGEDGLELRMRFFDLLSKYKQVDAAGRVRNNLGYQVQDKLPFVQNYKFTISFENTSFPGYVTEKLVDPMFALSVPIYWGSPKIFDDFNPESMVIATDRRLEDVVEEVVALDLDDSAYLAKLREPWFHGNVQNQYCRREYLAQFLTQIFTKGTSR